MLNFIVSMHQNRRLIETIKHILEVFPEAVIIRGFKDDKTSISDLFVNIAAKDRITTPSEFEPAKFIISNPEPELEGNQFEQNVVSYKQLLSQREQNLDQNKEDMHVEQVCPSYSSEDFSRERKEKIKYYSIKSVPVSWPQCPNAFMHVFVDNTMVKNLEHEQTSNKCLHIMFSSISHEFRTPMNAFINAVEFIKMNNEKLKEVNTKIKNLTISNVCKIQDKNLKMASVSSKILLSLTEDVLDFAKIEAGRFQLNERPFKI